MVLFYGVGLSLLRQGNEVGGYDIADACTELIEEARTGWATAFGVREDLLRAVWDGERMVFAEEEEGEEVEGENSEAEEGEEDCAGEASVDVG